MVVRLPTMNSLKNHKIESHLAPLDFQGGGIVPLPFNSQRGGAPRRNLGAGSRVTIVLAIVNSIANSAFRSGKSTRREGACVPGTRYCNWKPGTSVLRAVFDEKGR